MGGQPEEQNDDGRPKRGALCGSHKTVVPNCVNVRFYCGTSLAVLFSGSTVGVKTDVLVVSLPLVAAAVRKRRRRLQRVPEAFECCRCSWCTLSRRSRSRSLLLHGHFHDQ